MLIKKLNEKFLIVLDKEQKLVSTLTEIVTDQKIKGGYITGIGAIKNVELGYFEIHKKDYIRKTFEAEDYELIALNGNITLRDGAPYVHVHTAIGTSEFSVYGGHLFEAIVAVTAEIHIMPFGLMPERQFQDNLGLQTIARCPN